MPRLFAFLLLVLAVSPALAEGPPTMGVLAPHIAMQPNGKPWRVLAEDDALVVENVTEPGLVTYYYVQPLDRPLTVSVQTAMSGTPSSVGINGAGLIYALQGEGPGRLYYLFLLEPDGTVSVLRRDEDGINQMMSSRIGDLDTSGPVELAIRETPEGAAFFVNGQQNGTVQSRGIGSGAVGIVATGIGKFVFRNFRIGRAG